MYFVTIERWHGFKHNGIIRTSGASQTLIKKSDISVGEFFKENDSEIKRFSVKHKVIIKIKRKGVDVRFKKMSYTDILNKPRLLECAINDVAVQYDNDILHSITINANA